LARTDRCGRGMRRGACVHRGLREAHRIGRRRLPSQGQEGVHSWGQPATITGRVLKAHPAEPVVGVAKVEHGRVRAERLAAAPAQVGWLVDGDGLGSESAVLVAITTLGGSATGGLPLGLAGGAATCLLAAGPRRHDGAGRAGRGSACWATADPGGHHRPPRVSRILPPPGTGASWWPLCWLMAGLRIPMSP